MIFLNNFPNTKFLFVFAFIFLLHPADIFCQEKNALFDHLTVEDGLSNSLIFEITQDSLGFIWMATLDGLNRFDGYNFKVFRGDDSIKTVSDNWIACATTDKEGNIWYGTRTSGIGKVDLKSGRFTNYKDIMYSEFGDGALNIQNLFFTKDGRILIGSWGAGLLIFNPSTLSFEQYKNQKDNSNSISEDRVYAVFEDSKGNIWAGTQRTGLNKINVTTGQVTHYDLISRDPNSVSNNFVLTVTEDYNGDIWAGTYSDGLFKINPGDNKIVRYGKKYGMYGNRVSKVFEDSQKNLWICTNGTGVFKFLRDGNKFINYKYSQFNDKSLNSDKVWTMTEDKNGLLWFGTLTNGVNIYNKRKNEFKRLVHLSTDKNTIIDSYIKSLIFDSKDRLWVGTQNGISILHNNKSMKHITDKTGLKVNDVRVIYERDNGEMWIGTWGGGVNIYDPSSSKFKYLVNQPGNPNSLADNYLGCILEVDDKIYIGTERGLNEYNPETGKFRLFNYDEDDSTSISNSQVKCLYVDSKGNFWVGTNIGLNLFDKEKGLFNRINTKNFDAMPQRRRIREIYEDSKGNIWIGTLGAGFAKYNFETGGLDFFNQKDGLSNNAVFEILEDEDGYLWISTGIGLNRFDPASGKFVVYTVVDGLPNNEFNSGAAVKDKNGILYFGGVNGLAYFNPVLLVSKNIVPNIAITNVLINGIEFDRSGFYNRVKVITLPYDKNFINISFAALDYSDPASNTFRYKLEGLNDKWVNSGTGNTAVFTNLAHGEYVFRLQGANKYGVWNNNEKSLKIIISPPLWDTTIARLFYVILFLFLIYGVFKLRVKSMQRKQLLLEKIVDERTRDLRDSKKLLEQAVNAKDKLFSIVAHDLKNPFGALLGYSEFLKKNSSSLSYEEQQESIDGIYNAANSLYSLLQNLLAWARLQLHSIECSPGSFDVSPVIENVFGIYSVTASGKSISLINNVKEKTMIFADQNMTEIIFRNIVSNSIKFTQNGGKVEISALQSKDKIEIIIKDNGIGIDKEKLNKIKNNEGSYISSDGTSSEKGTGLGIMLAKEFTAQNGGTFNIESKVGEGTKVKICFRQPV